MSDASRIVNAFTVDLEDWFQGLTSTNPLVDRWPSFESRVVPATHKLLRILDRHQVSATFFVLGYTADQHPSLIDEIAAAGHEIGVHGYFHRFTWQLTLPEFEKELARSIEALVRITGKRPIGHRAPYFSINKETTWALAAMKRQGIRYDSSIFPTRNMLYGYPGAPRFPYVIDPPGLLEFPPSTARLANILLPVGGGFYLRALPYAVVRWAIRQLHQQGQPAIIYCHPWELDTDQHYRRVTFRERITHYYGRHRLEDKLERLLAEFRFQPLRALFEQVDGGRQALHRRSLPVP